MRIHPLARALGALLALAPLSAAFATDNGYENTLTGDWGGTRSSWADSGVALGGGYVGEFATNTSGGTRKTSAYADQIWLSGDFDFQKMFGWQGGSLHVDVVDRNGTQLDNKASLGSLLETQEIYGRGNVTRLTRFYLEQKFAGDLIDVRVGRMDVSNDFFPFTCDFQSLNFCASLPGYVTQGWYTMPISQTGAVVRISPDPSWYVKVGGYQVNPNNLNTDQRFRVSAPGRDIGKLGIVELGFKSGQGQGELPGSWVVGAWRNTAPYADLRDDVNGDPAVLTDADSMMRNGLHGVYATVKQKLGTNASGGGLTLFANVVQADSHTDTVDQLLSLGFFLDAPFAARPADRISFALGRDRVSDRVADNARIANAAGLGPVAVPRYEYDAEVNYNFSLGRGVVLMPNFQYIRHPGGLATNSNAAVLGLRVAASF
ncbi:carbohydrate porin [Dyella sp. 333MFSha]|uniref:carbohydrate porin n=1 Tax=Dyella sp. 333MFSha TaxID=1798240 RepID=UPI00088EB098|nr:carbohydrate porin [Dyella sp. 333MFSha]SDG24247.1 porin, OprB family [Dyella sp. 333MFSha]